MDNTIRRMSDEELIQSILMPRNGQFIQANPLTGRVLNGNTRLFELFRRGLTIQKTPYKKYNPDNWMFIDDFKEPPKTP